MTDSPKILAFAGSLRHESWNRKLVHTAAIAARNNGGEVTEIDLAAYPLPIYNEDDEAKNGLPGNVVKLKKIFLRHHGLLLACPEYNSSITAALKNVIDWVSRPHGDEKPLACFDGKVAALLATSPGGLGGLRGLAAVRSILSSIRVIVLPDQFALPQAHAAFNDDGSLSNPDHQVKIETISRKLVDTTRKLHSRN